MISRLIAVFLAGFVVALLPTTGHTEETKLIYAIFWQDCEQTCQGFVDGIKESGLDAEIIVKIAEQDKALLPGYVEEARSLGADLVLTYGTSVTLGIAGTLDDVDDDRFIHDIPLVFTYVADPFGTRIAESFEGSGRTNVTGTYNRVPETVNMQVIRSYDPGFQRLGLLYNSNELNSMIKLEELRELSETEGFELIALEIDPEADGAPDPAKIPERMAEIAEIGVDFMYLGSSSFLHLNGRLYTESAVENGIPVLSPYESLVREASALLSVATLEDDVGRLAAEQALLILRDGKSPGDLPIARASEFAYVVNMEVAKELNRFPPFEFMQVAEAVH